MASQGVFHYRAGAPCAVCHAHAPDDVIEVSRSNRINASYVRTITFSVPVCEACKRHFEAPHIFGLRRWLTTEFKIAPWLKKYLISERSPEAKGRKALTCVFGHKWKGCKCICGKTRNEGHDWSQDCERCSQCGARRSDAHTWEGCNCSRCKATRDKEHEWSKDCERCSRCGAKRSDAHNWKDCTCIICGLTRDSKEHSWGADLQTCTSCGRTRSLDKRLYDEANAGHLDAVLALIDKGAGVNYSVPGFKLTPLIWAAHKGYVDIVRVLLDRGADVNATDAGDRTALHHAIDGDDNVALMVRELMVRELVDRGADVHVRDGGGTLASEIAKDFGCAEAVQFLKAREAATKCTVDSSSVRRKDLMNEIEAILLDQSSDDEKQANIHTVLCTLDDGFATQTQKPDYCACGYPTRTLYRDGSSGPLFNLVASRQWSENDPYTTLYICPHCGRHVQRITQ